MQTPPVLSKILEKSEVSVNKVEAVSEKPSDDKSNESIFTKNYRLRQVDACKEVEQTIPEKETKMDRRLRCSRRESKFSNRMPESSESSDYHSSNLPQQI